MNEFKYCQCPFCGCLVQIRIEKYPNGDKLIEPIGRHDDDCPLSPFFWYTYLEDKLTEENLTERWNKRIYE